MTPQQLENVREQIEILLHEQDIDLDLGKSAKELSQTMVHSISEEFEVFENEDGHKVYGITCIQDFLKIPEDRLEDCLKDFKVGTDILRPIYELATVMGDVLGAEGEALMQRKFMWIDDGIHGEEAANTVTLHGLEVEGDMMRVQLSSPGKCDKKVEES